MGNKNTITTDLWPHPLNAEGRQSQTLALPPGTTVEQLVSSFWPGSDRPLCALNGGFVQPRLWSHTCLQKGDIVTLRASLKGGGDSDPLSIVLTVAVIAASLILPGLGPTLFTIGETAFTLGHVAALGVSVIGGLVINALAQPHLPDPPPAVAAAEPVYSLAGGTNRARLYEPPLLVLGRHRVFPDLGAREYTEFRGTDQYLKQIFHFGLGDITVEALKIGETPIDNFDEVETQWGGRDGRVTLFPGNVDTEPGAALTDTAFIERTTSQGATHISLDFTGRLFRVDERKGSIHNHNVTIAIEWEDDNGVITHRRETFSHASQTPLRRSLDYYFPVSGRYAVRVRRISHPSDDRHVYDDITWTALRTYQADPADYSGQARLGVSIRASGQLTGRLDRVTGIVSQRIPTWNGRAWTPPQPSANPAWLFSWYAKGIRVGNRLVAGAGLAINRIDEEAIKAWGDWCNVQGLSCNAVIDRRMSHAEVLALIAQCGRASPTWQSGKLGVIWDAGGRPATALITPGNIIAGSFTVEYGTERVAEEIVVRYIDPELDWQTHSIRRMTPGSTGQPTSTATLTLKGVTNRRQAAIEANLQAARQIYHRRLLKWEMGPEGLAIARGDVVHLTHSLIDGGATGRLIGGSAQQPKLERAVTLKPGDHMLFRLADGRLHTARVMPQSGAAIAFEGPVGGAPPNGQQETTIILDPPLPEDPGVNGTSPLDILWRHYPANMPPSRVRIIAMEPAGRNRIRFQAIDEIDAYYAAATHDLSVPLPAIHRHPPQVLAMMVSETLIRVGNGFAVELVASLTVAGDWRGGVLRMAEEDGETRTVARINGGETEARWIAPASGTFTLTVIPGTEVAPDGEPFIQTHEMKGFLTPPSAPSNFLIDLLGDGTRRLRWTPPQDPHLAGVMIRYARQVSGSTIDWEAMTPLHKGYLTTSPLESVEPPSGIWVFSARAIDTGNRLSDEVRIVAELGPQRQGNTLVWRCPSDEGWPGTIRGAQRSDDGADRLTGIVAYSWTSIPSWNAWASWSRGAGTATTRLFYTTEPVDLGTDLDVALDWSAEVTGNSVFQVRFALNSDTLDRTQWQTIAPATTIKSRFIQLRWLIDAVGNDIATLDHLCFSILAPTAERRLLDRNTATWQGTATTGRVVPHDLTLVTDMQVTLQSVGPGWSWSLDNKNNPTRIKIFDGTGQPADATIDITLRGIAAS